uniref:Syntrophin, gamma 2 n=1 Tax=Electrophorus electricus TaxID=8005 RepID=A0A4W4F677_ELEEL
MCSLCLKTKTGLALLYDENTNNTYDIRLKLTKEMLTIQKQDVVCIGGGAHHVNGGAEHKVPVVISKIFKDQVGKTLLSFPLNFCVIELVHLLRTAGDEVTITVRYLREAPAFLKLPLGEELDVRPASDQSSRASSPLFDSGLHLNGNSSNTVSASLHMDSLSTVPIEMIFICNGSFFTAILLNDRIRLSNSFEVFALDGVCTNVLQFCTEAESTDWLQAIATNINDLTQESCKCFSAQIIHMGWVCKHLHGSDASQIQSHKFLALKGSSLYILRGPPVKDCWVQAKLYVGLQQDCELRDGEPFCFSVLVGHGQSHCFSVVLGAELALWDRAFQKAVFMEVQRAGSKTYMCSNLGKILCFTIDFESGFSCSESISKVRLIWRYKFSQLKGSSDDGKTRVKLLFQNSENKQIEMKELEFANLTAVLHCIHSFIAAKVASVDPLFVNNQSITRKYMFNS